MAFTVRIVVTDLCALVRRSPQELDILLVDARTPTPAQEAAGMQRHEPMLGVPSRNLASDPANRTPDRLVPDLAGDTLAIFELSREELAVSTPSLLDVVSFPLSAQTAPRSSLEEQNLAWIAKLSPTPFSLTTLHPAALGDLSTGPVVSRVRITGGRVTCKRVFRDGDQPRQFDLKSGPGSQPVGPRRALGDLVQIELTMLSAEENHGPQITSSSGRSLSIVPTAGPFPVDLLIGNLALDPQLPDPGSSASHFRWFYELLQSPPPLLNRVIPFSAPQGPLTATRPTSPCPMIFIDGSNDV